MADTNAAKEVFEEINASGKKRKLPLLWIWTTLAIALMVVGVYLLARWDTLGGTLRALAIISTSAATLMLLPVIAIFGFSLAVKYFLKKVTKGFSKYSDEIVEQTKALYQGLHTFRPADPDHDFANVDRAWYDTQAEALATVGFRQLGDVIDETIQATNGVTIPIRILTSIDGTTGIAFYHIKVGPNDLRICEIGTEYSDGSFNLTSNGAENDLMTAPPQLRKRQLPISTSPDRLLQAHAADRLLFATRNPELVPVPLQTLKDVLASQDRQQQIKNDFRENIGFVDPAEIRRIAEKNGTDPLTTARLVASVDDARQAEHDKAHGPHA